MFKFLILALSLQATAASAQNVYPPIVPQNNTNLLPLNNTWTGTNTFNSAVTIKAASTLQIGASSPIAIYQQIFPGVTTGDALNAAITIPSNATALNIPAIAGYFRNLAAGGGAFANGVGLFSAGTCEVNNSFCWGINTLLQDSATRVIGSGTGRLLKSELDYNVMNPATNVYGLTVTGNSLAQPAYANGFQVDSLGTGIKWTNGFYVNDGVSTIAFTAGAAAASGSNISSTPVDFSYFDGSSAKQTIGLYGSGGFLVLNGSTGFQGFSVSSGNVFLNSGYGLYLNGTRQLAVDGPGTHVLLGDGSTPIQLQTVTAGTPAASLCITSSNTIIVKLTAGSCI